MITATAHEIRLVDTVGESLLKVHELFVETIGPDDVEDLDSFRRTVSPITSPALVPKIVEAYDGSQLIGAMLGVYLRRVNGGMVLYAGVREAYRRRGLYTEMRSALLGGLTSSPRRVWGSCLAKSRMAVGCTESISTIGEGLTRRWTTSSRPRRGFRDGP